MDLNEFINKLKKVLKTRRDMFIIARTDASDPDDIAKRVEAFAEAGADAILVDAIGEIGLIKELKNRSRKPFAFNQIAGGKSPRCNLSQLREAGVSIVIYSTPCLFAAQASVDRAMRSLKEQDGLLNDFNKDSVDLRSCSAFLYENLAGRDGETEED
jgi:2-methylisocitrate lyase-like PEP mutase family enzyme